MRLRKHILILKLGKAEKICICARDDLFNGSWEKMLRFIHKKGSEEQKKHDIPIIKRLSAYEDKYRVNIREMMDDEEGGRMDRNRKMPLCNIRLSTGYEIPIDFDKLDKDLDHLANALIGEIFTPAIKKSGFEKATKVMQMEIMDLCQSLSNKSKTALLSTILWRLICKKYGRIIKGIKTKNTS